MNHERSINRTAGILLILQGLLIFVPLIVLGAAINWPANLSEPASVNLPLLIEQASAVRLGYSVYLLYSILFWPVALLTARVAAGSDTLPSSLKIAVGFGLASMIARCIGIVRWLAPMPVLARLYTAPDATPQIQQTITVVFEGINAYGGTIGEALGVSLFAAIWAAIVSIALLRSRTVPRWVGVFGLIAALSLAINLVELFGVDLGALITATTAVVHFWFLALGVVLLRRASSKR
jgi:hypothetical protein